MKIRIPLSKLVVRISNSSIQSGNGKPNSMTNKSIEAYSLLEDVGFPKKDQNKAIKVEIRQ